jgi:hypothetical protein
MEIPAISTQIFGSVLVSDSAGMYPGLELFNYLYHEANGQVLKPDGPLHFYRTSQDFSRRLVWDSERFSADGDGEGIFVGPNSEAVLRHLMECLKLNIPNRRSQNWEAAHFFPYTRSLVHWDARRGRNQRDVQIERRYYRGGGALAHRVLRSDPDKERLDQIRENLDTLLPISDNTSLERLAAVLDQQSVKSSEAKVDEIENGANVLEEDGENDIYRNGIRNILSHIDLSSSSRVKAIVTWTGFWLATSQARRAAAYIGSAAPLFVIDCGKGAGQIRRESNRGLKDIINTIMVAASECADRNSEPDATHKGKRSLSGFFTTTCAWIGLLNAFGGKRHFTVSLDLLETLVMSSTSPEIEIPFEEFLFENLYNKWGLLIGREAASDAGLSTRMDASIFEDNELIFAQHLLAAGLMHDYSDATRMVSTRSLK